MGMRHLARGFPEEGVFRISGGQEQDQGVQPQDDEHVQPAQGIQGVQPGGTGGNGRGGGHGGGEEEREQVRTEKGVFIRIPPNMPEQRGIVLDFHGGRG